MKTTDRLAALDQMRADAVLPADVRPGTDDRPAPAGAVILTGATGFVGAFLLHTLLRDTPVAVRCLVRPDRRGLRGGGLERIRRNLEEHGLWEPAWADRIQPVEGDLRRPGLGWGESQQAAAADGIDAIFHGAAAVNWVQPYGALRAANVLGTLELLRLACRRSLAFHFVSTLGVCYAARRSGGMRVLSETDDPLPLLDRLHLGYAESKAVAEALVRQARARGLPAVVYRPALITGDSRSGAANPEDFLARGIGACVRMGLAPDVDWTIDACPVDHVALAVVRHATAGRDAGAEVLHLVHPQPRHWRELVLWMRLSGYPLRLVPYRDWLRQLERTAGEPDHPLHPLLGFFQTRVGGHTLPETYLGRRRTGVCAARTRQTLAALGVTCPGLDARWLERFFGSLTERGVVPPRDGARPAANDTSMSSAAWDEALVPLLRRHFADPNLAVRPAAPAERLSDGSILTELISWRCGSAVGVFRQPLELHSCRPEVVGRLDAVIKVKAEDGHLLDVITAAAALCDPRVGEAFVRWRDRLGMTGGHLREIALYGQTDERWRRWTPRAYAAAWDADRRRGWIVLEDLAGGAVEAATWEPAWIEAAIRALAELQAIWLGRGAELLAQPWLGPVATADGTAAMADLWCSLADHAARFFVPWLGPDVRRLQRRLLARLGRWWRPLEQLPHTLIHNDFNPRNLGLRPGPTGPRPCAYDWELATAGVPQHDLAQFLCFVLPYDCPRAEVAHYLELHRVALERASGCRLDAADWRHGFGLALADLLLNRWAMYALVHAVRRQPFLERVLNTWRTLFAYLEPQIT
jgi:thioester reductase-like protein